MAEEGLSVAAETAAAAAASPSPLDLKRKLGDLEAEEAPAEQAELSESNGGDVESADSDEAGAKRPRLDDKPDASAGENGHQEENADEGKNEDDDKPQSEEVSGKVTEEKPAKDSQPQDSTEEQENQPHPSQDHQPGDDHSTEQDQPTSDSGIVTRRMEIPNNKVGVLIGKSGDTIKYLQYNSGAKIQITKDVDSDPHSTTRPVEMVGTLDSVKKAEKLINAVIAEADAGGSPSLVARGLGVSQAAAEQIEIQVPNEKVGVIIGKGGETIKGLQTRSGARIQLIPQHLPEGDESKERTVRVTGDKRQIETAREMIKEVMNQPLRGPDEMRPSSFSGGFNQQGYRPRGPPGPHQWGPRGHHMGHPSSYDYPQRGPYSSHNQQYPPYPGYPQQMGPRSGYSSGGWEQRPPPSMHQHGGGGYDYYGGHKSHFPEPGHAQHSAPPHAPPGPSPNPAMGPPHSQQSYNYGQHQGPDYGNSGPYSQSAHHQQSYGQGYDDHAPPQHHYGGSQPYTHAGAPTGYGPAQHYGKPPYGMQSQVPPPQSYGPPRPNQSTDAPYQGSAPAQSYGQNVPPQQPYSYASTAPAQQQNYPPPYGSAPAPAASADGYNQAPAASAPSYPQQGTQPVASYGQSGTQTAPTYAQAGPAAAYGQYPSQQGYADQSAANAAAYGYQGSQDPAVYGAAAPASAYGVAPPAGQQLVYAAQATTQAQQSYDQSGSQQAGTYGVQPSTSAGYGGKTVSPQPGYAQYDSTQMYAAPH